MKITFQYKQFFNVIFFSMQAIFQWEEFSPMKLVFQSKQFFNASSFFNEINFFYESTFSMLVVYFQ
jgi:hypothetical protein